jgi:hypothetical protein
MLIDDGSLEGLPFFILVNTRKPLHCLTNSDRKDIIEHLFYFARFFPCGQSVIYCC